MKKLSVISGMFFCLLMSNFTIAYADFEGELKTYSLSMRVEYDVIPTKIYLALNVFEFNVPANEVLKSVKENSPELTLKKLLESIKNKDLGLFKQITDQSVSGDSESTFNLYLELLKDSEPVIVRRFDLGNLSYFILDVQKKDVPGVPVLIIRKENQFVQNLGLISHPLILNISAIDDALTEMPDHFSSISNPQYNNEIVLTSLFGTSQENPVYFRFTGSKISVSLFDNARAKKDNYPSQFEEPIAVYKNMNSALKQKARSNTANYAQYFGPRSREKVINFFNEVKARKKFDEFTEYHTQYREASYIIESDNLYILFHQSGEGEYRSGGLQYDMLFRYPDGNIKRVNYYIEGNIDNLLQWTEFSDKFIKEVINAEN